MRDVHTRMRVHTHVRMACCTYIYIRTHRLAGVDRTGGEERRGQWDLIIRHKRNIAGRPDSGTRKISSEGDRSPRGRFGSVTWDGMGAHTPWLNIFYIEPDRFTDELTEGKSVMTRSGKGGALTARWRRGVYNIYNYIYIYMSNCTSGPISQSDGQYMISQPRALFVLECG